MTTPWVGSAAETIARPPRPPTQPTVARLVTEVRASGRRAEFIRNAARFMRWESFSDVAARLTVESAIDSASRAPSCSARQLQHQPAPSGRLRAGREAARRVTIVRRPGASRHLGHTQPVRVESACDRHQPCDRRGPPRRRRCRTAESRAVRRVPPRPAPAPAPSSAPVTSRDIRSSRAETSGSSRGRPSWSSATRSAAASKCNRASACNGARCQTPTRALAPPSSAWATRSEPAKTGSPADPRRVCSAAAVEHRRSAGRPQRGLGGGHRPATQVGPVPVRPAERVAGVFAPLRPRPAGPTAGPTGQRSRRPTLPGMASSKRRVYIVYVAP